MRLHSLPLAGLVILLACAALAADEDKEILFHPGVAFPAQGGPAFRKAYFPAGAGTLVGGRGEVVFKGSMGLGIGSYSLSSELVADQFGSRREIGLSYGGLVVDYSFFGRRLLYFNVACLAGPAQAWAITRELGATRSYTDFYIAEPELSLMLNATSDLRLGLGISYRVTGGADNERILGSSMNGFAMTFTMMYGKTD